MSRNSSPFWQLVENEHKRARAYCYRLTGSTEDGDDLYQDSVLRALRGFNDLREADSFRPWFYRIINNAYKARFRTSWWRRMLPLSDVIATRAEVRDPTESYEAKRRLEYAFAALSTEDRIIVTLAELEQWKISEVAELLSRNDGFIKMRLFRARKKMRERLSRHCREAREASQKKEIENVCCVTRPEKD